jgi:hypothetical protein
MKMRKTTTCVALLLACIGPAAIGETSQAKTVSQILQHAADITGIVLPDSASRGVSDSVAVVDFTDTITPYLGEYATGHRVWRVTMTDLRVADRKDSVHDWPGRIEAFVDSASGNLLKVVWTRMELDPENDLEVGAATAEKEMAVNGEVYESCPIEAPATSFAAAASVCPHSPLSAKQIVGQYVMWREGGRATRPVWVLQFRGIPSIWSVAPSAPPIPNRPDVKSYQAPLYQQNRMRYVVNAHSGNCITGSTIPAIPLKPADRERLFPEKDNPR